MEISSAHASVGRTIQRIFDDRFHLIGIETCGMLEKTVDDSTTGIRATFAEVHTICSQTSEKLSTGKCTIYTPNKQNNHFTDENLSWTFNTDFE